MTTREFINKNIGVPSPKDRQCSSVFADRSGNLYSYGYHYPLLFKVGNKLFRNVTGYSNSTAKHINWAGDNNAIDVCLSGCNQYSWRNSENADKVPNLLYLRGYGDINGDLDQKLMQAIIADLKAEIADILERMNSKKRHDTQVYKMLENEMQHAIKQLERARA